MEGWECQLINTFLLASRSLLVIIGWITELIAECATCDIVHASK